MQSLRELIDKVSGIRYRCSYSRLIGFGAYGTVYELIDAEQKVSECIDWKPCLGRLVVKEIKVKKTFSENEDEIRARLERLVTLKRLDNPHIVKCIAVEDPELFAAEYCRSGERIGYYMLLEYCEGGDLKNRIGKNLLTQQEAFRYAHHLLDAVVYLHTGLNGQEGGLVHGDIAGDNIFLSHDFQTAKLGDLDGLVRVGPSGYETNLPTGGKGLFMSPEMHYFWFTQDRSRADKVGLSTDIWSIGCVLVEMLSKEPLSLYQSFKTHKLPILPTASYEVFVNLLIGKYGGTFKPNYQNHPLSSMLDQCFALEPSDRPTARQISETIGHHLSSEK